MATIRVKKKEKNFVVMQKDCINDTSLSWAARGVHSFLLAQADSWKTSISGLVAMGTSKKFAVSNMIKELVVAGFIEPYTNRDGNGQIVERGYIVYEERQQKPIELLESKNQEQVKTLKPSFLDQAFQEQGNQRLINNKNKINNKQKKKEERSTSSSNDLVFIGDQLTEVQRKYICSQFSVSKIDRKNITEADWMQAIELELLDKNSFKGCKQKFTHKLNTILSIAKGSSESLWNPEVILNADKVEKSKVEEKLMNDLKFLIFQQESEVRHFQGMFKKAVKTEEKQRLHKILEKSQQKLIELYKDLKKAQYTHANELREGDSHAVISNRGNFHEKIAEVLYPC